MLIKTKRINLPLTYIRPGCCVLPNKFPLKIRMARLPKIACCAKTFISADALIITAGGVWSENRYCCIAPNCVSHAWGQMLASSRISRYRDLVARKKFSSRNLEKKKISSLSHRAMEEHGTSRSLKVKSTVFIRNRFWWFSWEKNSSVGSP